jgi:carbamoyl-phosphate synthase large subunit
VGTPPDSIDRAEDRERFEEVLAKLDLKRPPNGVARSAEEAIRVAEGIGYPILVRPSYVLGGRAMEIVYDRESLARYMRVAVRVSPAHPVLIDQFLEDAIEVDVDAVSDGQQVVIGGIMEHIERSGVHSGDSACSLPPYSLGAEVQGEIRRQTVALARELKVVGLMNVQFAVKGHDVYVLEVNPRASRTVPFVSKAIGVPLAKIAARCMVGRTLASQGFTAEIVPEHVNVKEAVFPFIKFPGVDTVLGPEMKSTGEVMGIDGSFGAAFAKAQVAASTFLPTAGRAFVSVHDDEQDAVVPIARRLVRAGFTLLATRGTAERLQSAGLTVETINKVHDGSPHIVDALHRGEVALVINTPVGADSVRDAFPIRRAALECRVPYFTTLAAAAAAAEGIELMIRGPFRVRPLQEHHERA